MTKPKNASHLKVKKWADETRAMVSKVKPWRKSTADALELAARQLRKV